MTSKVEALLADIKNALDNTANEINPCFTRGYIGLDDSLAELVALAHAEGVAEERERIRSSGELITEGSAAVNAKQFSEDTDERLGITDLFARRDLYIIPASILAGTEVKK